ncbi:MAG TPA: DoxX family protein [Vicinamibacterales bacterium]|nr:DoxX family protein [Vicinamibacterales bacterium]
MLSIQDRPDRQWGMNTSAATRWAALAPYLKSLLRIVAAFTFMQEGTMKWFGWPMAMPGGTPALMSQVGIAGLLEIIGGGLLLVGLFTRPVAFLLSGEMAVAYFQAHAPHGLWPIVNQGLPAVLYCFIWLFLSAAGAGPWSLDALRRRG